MNIELGNRTDSNEPPIIELEGQYNDKKMGEISQHIGLILGNEYFYKGNIR